MSELTTLLGRGQGQATKLAQLHPHPNDSRVTFDEDSHTYFVDGNPVGLSVTGVLKAVEREPFDAPAVAAKLARNPTPAYNGGTGPTGKLLPLAPADILKRWDDNRDLGTCLHGCLERHLNDLPVEDAALAHVRDEFDQALRWLAASGLTPYRTEWVIYDEACDVAGSVDFVAKNADGDLVIVDWKRCTHGGKGFSKHWRGETMLPPVDHLPECKLSHWSAQVNLYRVMLERNYGVRVAQMCMVALLPGQAEAVQYTHERDDAVAALLDRRRRPPTEAGVDRRS